jgi:hypothetical protein
MSIERDLLRDAYVYLLSRAIVTRQEIRDLSEPGVEFNSFKHNPVDQAISDWVNPNLDVTNSEAWVVVDTEHAVRLSIPRIDNRYFTVQVLDEWGETITNINPRQYPLRSDGEFFFVASDFAGSLPEGAVRIELRSRKAKLLVRVELADDASGASDLQQRFVLEALGEISAASPAPVPDFANDALIGVELFELADELLAGVPDVSEVASARQALVRHFAALVRDPTERGEVSALLDTVIIPEFRRFATVEAGVIRNNWFATTVVGNYHDRVDIRSAANLVGLWANSRDEVVYFVTMRASNGEPLDGARSYVLDFAPEAHPQAQVDAYWSLSLVDVPNFVAVPNRLDRFTINGLRAPERDVDGHLRIYIGPDSTAVMADGAAVPDEQLLPGPARGPFSLTFRAYVPKDAVKRGEWAPPAVVRVD